ncbi:MAG: ABC transporter ATP-binding protein [Proteobacteria bacterium]|nr:ABC transporter ATP-binding protein [Pseudomonadota bacterium]
MKALSLSKLTKVYKNGFKALNGINLDVEEGDFFALLGPNGAGKSTTIGIISSLVTKTSGKVSVFGYDLDRAPDAVKRCIGLVPQEINFNQFEKARYIVANQAGYYGIRRNQALKRADECLEVLGLGDKRNQTARLLSGGMKRRLMIARALAHSPRLLILDEPTAGVDIEIRRSMWDYLRQLNRDGTTIILTTHYLEEAENLCRNIAIIDHGDIVENNAMGNLLGKLDNVSFILELRKPLEKLPTLAGYRLSRIDARTLAVDVPVELGIHGLFDVLSLQGIEVTSLRNASNRLEQFFMNLVENGRSDRPST